VGLKTGSAELVARGAESFAQAFPESKWPPVFLAGNSTWSRDAAMMLRTGHLLQVRPTGRHRRKGLRMSMRGAGPAALALAAWLAAGAAARAAEVRLQLTETEKAARAPAAVTSGVPFAKGALKDVGKLVLKSGGKPVPAQVRRTVKWEDGSVRWALVDTLVDVPPAAVRQAHRLTP